MKMIEGKTNRFIKPTNLYAEAKRRYQELTKIKEERQQELAKAPKGKIHIVKNNKKVQFYLRDDGSDKSGIYIHKAETAKIKTYLQKSYDEKLIKVLNSELKNLEILFKNPDSITSIIRQIYSNNPAEIKNMINPVDISDEDYIKSWMATPFKGKDLPEELPFYETSRKERVRSKSELNIANTLESFGIPYKYECPVSLKNGIVVYPDFTILNVNERKIIYWEHRGMMDDREYAKQAVFKVKQLRKNGIFLGDNLIITEETSTDPLGTDEIKEVIKKYLV